MRRLIITIISVVLAASFLAGCVEDPSGASDPVQQRKKSTKARAQTFARAEARYPLPHTENFPLRKSLIDMTKREDLDNHPWYIYVLADTGNVIGYYVGKTVPINACNFLSTTQTFEDVPGDGDDIPDFEVQAPSIDGIYYGDSNCSQWVFFDYSTNAEVKLGDVKFFTADKPLNLDAEPIKLG